MSLIKVGFLRQYSIQKKNWERFDQFQTLKNDFETQNFEVFDKVVHNFGKYLSLFSEKMLISSLVI